MSQVTLLDHQGYGQGVYYAFNQPWGAGSYVEGKDYTESSTVDTSTFPNNTTMTWDWSHVPAAGIRSFLTLIYGNYDNPSTNDSITAMPVGQISSLTETHQFTYSGDASGFNVIDDIFLTPVAGSSQGHSHEIEVFLHPRPSAYSWAESQQHVANVNISGVNWDVTKTNDGTNDLLFVASNGADVPSGSVDLKAMLNVLQSHGVISNQEWFNGFGTGVETATGAASINFSQYSIAYNSASPPPPPPPPPPTTTPSPDNTVILASQAGASITDGGGNVWKISNGVVQENGSNAGYSANVKELAYEKGVIWQENNSNLWWSWNGSGWAGGNGSTTSPVPSNGADDTLVLDLSEDAYKGDAMAQVLVDGKKLGSPFAVTASHASGQLQEFQVSLASITAGNHTIGVQFTNDLYGGTAATDRNMFVAPIKVGQMSGSAVINTTVYGTGIKGLWNTGDTRSFSNVLIAH